MFADVLFWILRIFVEIYTILSYPLYALIDRPWSKVDPDNPKAEVVSRSEEAIEVKSVVIECPVRDDLDKANVETMSRLFEFMADKFKNRDALGTRAVVREEKIDVDDGKVQTKLIQGNYEWKRYKETLELADLFAKGLVELQVGDVVGFYADTRAEWLVAAHGCWRNAIAVATVYTNLGADGIIHAMNQTRVETVVTSTGDLLNKLSKSLSELPHVKRIIYFESPLKPGEPEAIEGIELVAYSQVLEMGRKSTAECKVATPSDKAIIMYTSGSTGVPKGVVLSHANMMAGVKAILPLAYKAVNAASRPLNSKDSYIAFLPLAHVLEMLAEHVILLLGIRLGYSSAGTLTDKSALIKEGDSGDATVLKPAVMAAVPLVVGRIYKGIQVRSINSYRVSLYVLPQIRFRPLSHKNPNSRKSWSSFYSSTRSSGRIAALERPSPTSWCSTR